MKLQNLMLSMIFAATVGVLTVGAEDPTDTTIELAGGKIVMQMPEDWHQEKPKSQIVQYEFSAPADGTETEKTNDKKAADKARITIMGAGGSVEANVQRWYDQFEDGAAAKKNAKLEEFEAGGQKVHFVNASGSFKDTMGAGPFSGKPPVIRENYRMLGAIIVSKDLGQYFVKITGPDETVQKLEEGFKKMLKGLETK